MYLDKKRIDDNCSFLGIDNPWKPGRSFFKIAVMVDVTAFATDADISVATSLLFHHWIVAFPMSFSAIRHGQGALPITAAAMLPLRQLQHCNRMAKWRHHCHFPYLLLWLALVNCHLPLVATRHHRCHHKMMPLPPPLSLCVAVTLLSSELSTATLPWDGRAMPIATAFPLHRHLLIVPPVNCCLHPKTEDCSVVTCHRCPSAPLRCCSATCCSQAVVNINHCIARAEQHPFQCFSLCAVVTMF